MKIFVDTLAGSRYEFTHKNGKVFVTKDSFISGMAKTPPVLSTGSPFSFEFTYVDSSDEPIGKPEIMSGSAITNMTVIW